MRQFFKFMFASMIGTLLSIFFAVILFFIIVAAVVNSVSKNNEIFIANKSVLVLRLDHTINERSTGNPFENFDYTTFSPEIEVGLNDILSNIKKAKNDSRIGGIYLELSSIHTGIATIEEIRNALLDFKTSQKFIVAYSEAYTQPAYYLATVADEIYLYPEGILDFRGLSAEVVFLKGTLDKLEVEPQVIKHGKFKSAVEPFLMDKMSDESRIQLASFTTSIWKYLIKNIAFSRKTEENKLLNIADSFLIQDASDALKYKLVDRLAYNDQVLDNIKSKLGIDSDKKISFVTIHKYNNVVQNHMGGLASQKIAVIYAYGDIESGKGNEHTIGSERIADAIRKARLDTKVKAIIIRVNSPGGSALASDVIWREIVLAKKSKPVVASMGDYAASGGYYIACAADKIVSQPVTITGSIGVFGIRFNLKKLLNNKLGITVDTVKTGKYSDFGSIARPITSSERMIIQKRVENIYEDFISKVASGRNLRKSYVDSIGEGRVWSAIDAQKIGLIDELGGLDKAIRIAAKLAKLKKYRILELPEQKEPLEHLMEKISGDMEETFVKKEMPEGYKYYKDFSSLLRMEGMQARMPFSIEVY